jgi:carboxylesterase type B
VIAVSLRPSILFNRTSVQDGTYGDQCPQGIPIWRRKQTGTANSISTGSEDCLFLDVNVPRTVWEKRNVGRGAPVLVWIYGGGYTAGSKWQFGSGAGLLKQAASPIIYVALNYRVSLAGSVSYFATSTNYLGKAGY